VALPLYEGTGIAQGQDVIAVGHPQGFRFVTTTGIVSAIHRQDDLPDESQAYIVAPDDNTWIQTTAAISGGNSGGPLLDSDGNVIGINTWVAWGENMGFAGHVKHLIELRQSASGELVSLAELAEPTVRYNELLAEYESRQLWYEERLLQAETDAEREEILRTDPALEFAESLLALVDEFPQSSLRFECLSGAITMLVASDSPQAPEIVERAGGQLLLDYIDHPGLQDVVLALARSGSPLHYSFLQQLEQAAPDRTVQALACYAQGVCLMNAEEPEPEAGIAEWERLVVDYPDVEFMGQQLSMLVEQQLYEHRYFGIGRVAPDIVGRDADGVEFKLSDYRGQVVVLDFWADWCPHCVNMYPVERELIETYAGRPFAIVGVNGDSAERMQELAESGKVTWRSFDDGSFGPIAEQYHITGIPAIFVLDAEGVIRYKNVRGDELVAAVEELMSEMPAAVEEVPDSSDPPQPEQD
jgi:peroxiredoxin